jgi:hypothetical protein
MRGELFETYAAMSDHFAVDSIASAVFILFSDFIPFSRGATAVRGSTACPEIGRNA